MLVQELTEGMIVFANKLLCAVPRATQVKTLDILFELINVYLPNAPVRNIFRCWWRFVAQNITQNTDMVRKLISFSYPTDCIIIVQSNNYLFIWGFTSLSTLYRSYHDG